MIVVSDTSPIHYLVLINAADVLPKLFNEVFVPPKVIEELDQPHTPQQVRLWAQSPPPWLQVRQPADLSSSDPAIDPGEAHAIALARELKATLLLMDDRAGRRSATNEGLTVVGTVTVLELAAEKDLLGLAAAFSNLQRTNFRISQHYLDAALRRDADRKRSQ